MLSQDQIVKLDKILRSSGTVSIGQDELDHLNATGVIILDDCDYYTVAQKIIVERQKHQLTDRGTQDNLLAIAMNNGCDLKEKKVVKPKPVLPFLAGGRASQGLDPNAPSGDGGDAEKWAGYARRWAVGDNPPAGTEAPSDTNNSLFYSELSKSHSLDSADSANAAADSEQKAEQSVIETKQQVSLATDEAKKASESAAASEASKNASAQSESNAADSERLSKEWAIGPSGTPDTPADDNNAKYYKDQAEKLYNMMQEAAAGVYREQGMFTPEAAKEYPDATAFPAIWFLKPSDPKGYLFTTGTAQGFTGLYADLMVYSKSADEFHVLPQSLLHQVQQATESDEGIAKIASALAAADKNNHTDIMTPKTVNALIDGLTASDVGALPDDQYAQADKMGGIKARLDGNDLYISFNGDPA